VFECKSGQRCDLLVRPEPLVLEAKALDLVEVLCRTERVDIVRRNAGHLLLRHVLGRVEGQRCLARKHFDLTNTNVIKERKKEQAMMRQLGTLID